jgi:hypothetical protein
MEPSDLCHATALNTSRLNSDAVPHMIGITTTDSLTADRYHSKRLAHSSQLSITQRKHARAIAAGGGSTGVGDVLAAAAGVSLLPGGLREGAVLLLRPHWLQRRLRRQNRQGDTPLSASLCCVVRCVVCVCECAHVGRT